MGGMGRKKFRSLATVKQSYIGIIRWHTRIFSSSLANDKLVSHYRRFVPAGGGVCDEKMIERPLRSLSIRSLIETNWFLRITREYGRGREARRALHVSPVVFHLCV